jgi:hypothetical protein
MAVNTESGPVGGGRVAIGSAHVRAQIAFYVGFVAMLFLETTLWSFFGLFVGIFAFFAGGTLWALYEISRTEASKPLHGPVLRFMDTLLRARRKAPSFVAAFALAAMLGGAPGVGLVLAAQGSERAVLWAVAASALYAVVWALIH